MYFEFLAEERNLRGLKNPSKADQEDPQVLGTIMYSFLNHLQVVESERLVARNSKLKETSLAGLMSQARGQKVRPKNNYADSSDSDEDKNDQIPIGFDYSENFPELPDFDGKGKKMRQVAERRERLRKAQTNN